MAIYHWTTKENIKPIMKEGLYKWSFVCTEPDVWHGEICLKIEGLDIIVDSETWQGVTHRHVRPEEIEVLE